MGDERSTDFRRYMGQPTPAFARAADPETSQRAAAVIRLSDMERRTLDAILVAGERGSTSKETAAYLGVGRDSVSPRHKSLEAKGKIERTTERREGQIVWKAKR